MGKVLRSGNNGLKCPECKSHNIELYEDNMEYKTKTSLNLNPFHPFRLTNSKSVATQKKKVSGGKVAAAVLTGGASLLVTGGVKSKVNKQWYCKDCGCVFEE